MSLEKIRREISDTKRDLGIDVEDADAIAESKKQTMEGLASITTIPDEGDRQALEGARDGVRSDAKSDFASRVDRSLSEHASRSEGTQRDAQGYQAQVTENANAARSIEGSAKYGKGSISSFASLMAQRGQEYASAIAEAQGDVQDAKQKVDARRSELDS